MRRKLQRPNEITEFDSIMSQSIHFNPSVMPIIKVNNSDNQTPYYQNEKKNKIHRTTVMWCIVE